MEKIIKKFMLIQIIYLKSSYDDMHCHFNPIKKISLNSFLTLKGLYNDVILHFIFLKDFSN